MFRARLGLCSEFVLGEFGVGLELFRVGQRLVWGGFRIGLRVLLWFTLSLVRFTVGLGLA